MAHYSDFWEYTFGVSNDNNFTGGNENDTMVGRGGNDTLKGGGGNDTITGGDDNDKLYGESGNDKLDAGSGNDYLNGGWGNDTLYGDDGNDTLYGGVDNDKLDGDDGNDYLNGEWGSDYLEGDDGNDTLYGGDDNDTIYGGRDNDTLYGGDDNDTLYGEHGKDYLQGDSGDDHLNGGSGDDTIRGGSGNDTLIGGSGHDTLYATWLGSDGSSDYNKYLDGGSGNDSIRGGGGDDTLIGGTGNDTLDGRAGYDSLKVSAHNNSYDLTITNSAITQLSSSAVTVETDIISNIEAVEVVGNSNSETLDASSFTGDVTFESGEGNDTLIGSGWYNIAIFEGNIGDFTVTQNSNNWTVTDNNTSDGNQGTNTLTNIDEIHFSSDNVTGIFDTTSYSSVVSAVAGTDNGTTYVSAPDYNAATQYIIGLEGTTDPLLSFDTEKLGDFVNAITLSDSGGDTEASLWANIGLEVLGTGLKQVPVAGAALSTGVKIAQQLIDYGNSSAAADAQLAATEAVLSDANYSADSWIDFNQPNRDLIRITDFQIGVDSIILPSISDTTNVFYQMVQSTGGVAVSIKIGTEQTEDFLFIENNYKNYGITDAEFADTILDLAQSDGNENYNGSTISTFRQTTTYVNPNDFAGVAESGSYAGDIIQGLDYSGNSSDPEAGSFSLVGKYGDDLLQGANKDDYLYGGFNSSNPGTPFVYEHDGNDILQGNEGNDTLDGGSGNDILDGGEGTDTVDYSNDTAAVNVNIYNVSSGTATDGYGDTDTLINIENVIGSDYNDFINGGSQQSIFEGGDGNDTIKAGGGIDTIYGGDGNDILYGYFAGYSGNSSTKDYLNGEEGNDKLYGSNGNDTLIGGSGNDILSGRDGSDIFIFDSSTGTDTITDFSASADEIQIDQSIFGISSINDVSFDSSNGKLLVNNNAIAILSGDQSSFSIADDVTLV
jgi:Ca2+-binding RTX toxin-like protein